MSETKNLVDGILEEIDRVQKIVYEYNKIPAGFIAAEMMRNDIGEAKKILAHGDVIQHLQIYNKLKEWEM